MEDKTVVTIRKIYKNGILVRKEYLNDKGESHRDGDKPAIIGYFGDGKTIYCKLWCQNDDLHRDIDEPAYILYRIDGIIKSEEWYKNGKLYRTIKKSL